MKSKSKLTQLLKKYIRELEREDKGPKRLRVFDFDDTLVVTDAKVHVIHADGVHQVLTPAEFAVYEKQPGDTFDYAEFRQLINPRAIQWMGRILRNVYDKYGPKGIAILSARSTPEPILQFLDALGMTGIEVRALDNADPKVKAEWIDRWIRDHSLDHVEFFDDSPKNIAAVKDLRDLHPGVHVVVRHVIHTHIPTHGFTRHYGTHRRRRTVQGSSHGSHTRR
jgi:hypothetical protein